MKIRLNEKGFHWWLVPLIVVVLGIIGFTGWYVWQSNSQTEQIMDNSTNTTNPVKTTPTPTPVISATGNWSGNVSTEAPAACAGIGGGWEATLVDTDGNITGNFTALYIDYSGQVTGTIADGQFTLTITGPSGLTTTFTGVIGINSDAMNGTFVGTSCGSTGELMTGSFSAVRS